MLSPKIFTFGLSLSTVAPLLLNNNFGGYAFINKPELLLSEKMLFGWFVLAIGFTTLLLKIKVGFFICFRSSSNNPLVNIFIGDGFYGDYWGVGYLGDSNFYL